MSKTVWKFPLNYDTLQDIPMPRGAEILHFGMQGRGAPMIWAVVDPNEPLERRRFYFVGTGHPVPEEPATHVGTTIEAPFVWHLFARPPEV